MLGSGVILVQLAPFLGWGRQVIQYSWTESASVFLPFELGSRLEPTTIAFIRTGDSDKCFGGKATQKCHFEKLTTGSSTAFGQIVIFDYLL